MAALRIGELNPVDGGDGAFVTNDVQTEQACLRARREIHSEGGTIVIGRDSRPAVSVGEDSGRKGFWIKEIVGAGNELVGIFKVGKQLDSSAETDGVVPTRCPDFKTVYTCAEVDRPFELVLLLFACDRAAIDG